MFNKNYKNKIRELEKSNEELRKQLNAFENCVTLHVDFINKLLDIPEKGGLVYIANNKIAQYCLVMDHIESLKLYIANNTSYIGYLHYKIYETENYILLEDIQVENKDIGNGTILVEALKKQSVKLGIKRIIGYLSPIDDENTENILRRSFFYKKNGFIEKNRQICLYL